MTVAAAPAVSGSDLTVHLEKSSPAHYYITHDATGVPDGTEMVEEIIDIGGGAQVRAILYGNHLFLGPESEFPWHVWQTMVPNKGEPLVKVEVRGAGHTKVVRREYTWWGPRNRDRWGGYSGYGGHRRETVEQDDCYLPGSNSNRGSLYEFNPQDPKRLPYVYLTLGITVPDGRTFQVEWRFRIPKVGKVTLGQHQCGTPYLDIEVDVHGFNHTFREDFRLPRNDDGTVAYMADENTPAATLYRHLRGSAIVGGADALWAAYLRQHHDDSKTPTDNIASVYKRKAIAPNLQRLETEEPLDWTFFRWLHNKDTVGGKRNNQLLSAFLQEVGDDYDKLLAGLRHAREVAPTLTTAWHSYRPKMDGGLPVKRALCETLPGVAEKIQEMEAAKDFRKAKGLGNQADGLGVTADKYPKLREAIENGDIPIGVFNQPGKDGQPVNREFPLWERALSQPGWAEVIFEIARDASGRSTYERDITPYLSFLFKLPKYLDKHTESWRPWSAMPKFVKSQWELEMDDDANENGTQKRRSAFTPVADNETCTVTVPYVAVCVSGVRTQWCYSRHFYVFEEGFTDPESQGMVIRDLEPKLNGRDDYGLCYYTLTGTATARGYPTFLIIFEKRQNLDPNKTKAFVHFHRVRPCRSKNGVTTPACELVEACYQYMAGNIPASDITAQQGDLIFIRCNNDPIAAKAKVEPDAQTSPVLVFESHALQSLNPEVALTLHRSAAKTPQNRLGFVWAPTGLKVGHPEHDDIENLPEGWYEIRRCKSWEANPKAIWSLTID